MRFRPFFEATIVVADPDEDRAGLIARILHASGYHQVHLVPDLRNAASTTLRYRADLVILHLSAESEEGLRVLEQVSQATDSEDFVPILVLSSESNREARERAIGLGARDIIAKPFTVSEINLRVENLLHLRRLYLDKAAQSHVIENLVRQRTGELEVANRELLEHLATAAEYRDNATGDHTRRVSELTKGIALELGLTQEEAEEMSLASLLHDIGKIGVPDSILHKPAKLTFEEYETMKRHTHIGASILSGSRSRMLQLAECIALTHHERWDGNGYMGLVGEAIPLPGRIVAVADVFDALISDRPYKRAWPVEDAIAEIVRNAGSQFDPQIVSAFMSVMIATGEADSFRRLCSVA